LLRCEVPTVLKYFTDASLAASWGTCTEWPPPRMARSPRGGHAEGNSCIASSSVRPGAAAQAWKSARPSGDARRRSRAACQEGQQVGHGHSDFSRGGHRQDYPQTSYSTRLQCRIYHFRSSGFHDRDRMVWPTCCGSVANAASASRAPRCTGASTSACRARALRSVVGPARQGLGFEDLAVGAPVSGQPDWRLWGLRGGFQGALDVAPHHAHASGRLVGACATAGWVPRVSGGHEAIGCCVEARLHPDLLAAGTGQTWTAARSSPEP
jgi:hypothetical protein